MIFSSFSFLLIFLPISLVGYGVCTRIGPKTSATWLALCSIAFYAAWNVYFVVLLLGSIAFNFIIGNLILRNEENDRTANGLLALGITGNLLLLFYFKYFASVFNFALGLGLLHSPAELSIILPLGISFFTFTQIGYLVDCREGLGRDMSLIHYVVFVTLFPHLIAGPILHIREIVPQLQNPKNYRLTLPNLAVGLTYFTIGMTKKVLLADPMAQIVQFVFSDPSHAQTSTAWVAVLSYSVQLYFDFSGYSDMAIGLAAAFGFKFPLNFNSPYKSRSIIDFWQRFHMTLTRYLTLLLYNPISLWVTRRRVRQRKKISGNPMPVGAFLSMSVAPIMITMCLAGVWHGAGLQFFVFGLLHAIYLSVNHAWRAYGPAAPATPRPWPIRTIIIGSQVGLTYLCVLVAMVFFRSASLTDAMQLLAGMVGLHGLEGVHMRPEAIQKLGDLGRILNSWGLITDVPPKFRPNLNAPQLLLRYAIIFLMPNTQQIMSAFSPVLEKVEPPRLRLLVWTPRLQWAVAIGALFLLDLLGLNYSPPFLYFKF